MNFIITGAARTGSTMLRHALDSHDVIVCHGEVFTNDGIKGLSSKLSATYKTINGVAESMDTYYDSERFRFLEDFILSAELNECETIGFKFKTDEYFDGRYKDVRVFIKTKIEKVIHIKRQNLLDQYISHALVLKGINPTVLLSGAIDESSLLTRMMRLFRSSRIKVDLSSLDEYCQNILTRESELESELSHIDSMVVWYEDIIDNPQAQFSILCNFLEVKKQDLLIKTQKIVTDIESHVINYQEAKDFVQSKSYDQKR